MLEALIFLSIGALIGAGGYAWSVILRSPKEVVAKAPTRYQTVPIRLALELHRGKAVVVMSTATDKTILTTDKLFPLSDELRKYHTTAESVNAVIQPDVNADEATLSIPEVVSVEEDEKDDEEQSRLLRLMAERQAIRDPKYHMMPDLAQKAYLDWAVKEYKRDRAS